MDDHSLFDVKSGAPCSAPRWPKEQWTDGRTGGVQIGPNLRMLIGQLGGRTNQVAGHSQPAFRILIQIWSPLLLLDGLNTKRNKSLRIFLQVPTSTRHRVEAWTVRRQKKQKTKTMATPNTKRPSNHVVFERHGVCNCNNSKKMHALNNLHSGSIFAILW